MSRTEAFEYLIPVTTAIGSAWPSDLFNLMGGESIDSALTQVGVAALDVSRPAHVNATIVFRDELAIEIPGIAGLALIFGGIDSRTEVDVALDVWDPFELGIVEFPIRLRFPLSLFKPVQRKNDQFVVMPNVHVEFGVNATMTFNGSGEIMAYGLDDIIIMPFMIGDSGVVVEADSFQLRLSIEDPLPDPELSEGWKGIFIPHAKVHLPGMSGLPDEISFAKCSIGSGGFSGELDVSWDEEDRPNVSFFGLKFVLAEVYLDIRQNAITEFEITGQISIPFFEEPIDVVIGIDLEGKFLVQLARDEEGGEASLSTIEKEDAFRLELDSVGFELEEDLLLAKLGGELTPCIGEGLNWPTFQVEEFAIDSEGNVYLEGGWLDLREQYSLDFYGFQFEITRLGFGKTDDGGKWIGFSGGLKLVDGFSAGGSAEGLRLIWYENEHGNVTSTKMTLDGIGVEFEVPDVLRFKGMVSFDQAQSRFSGDIRLELLALDMQLDAKLVVGSEHNFTYFAIYLGVELPAGIPLFSTGLALYGMAGLFALQYEPDKEPTEEWYGVGPEDGWFKRPEIGVTDLEEKWTSKRDALALGAGVTVGTLADNGFAFSGKVLFVIVFPGPILLIEGKANLLRERAKLGADDEPVFRALAVLDGRAGSFLVGLDAQYKYGDGGELLDIRAGAEAFFSFSDASLWHLYLGQKEPRERRIRAEILSLFAANTYFMLDAHQLALGAWVGFDERWKFGPLRVVLEAWIESNVAVSWKPAHFYGDLWLHGEVGLSFSGVDLVGMYANAGIAADVFDPFHLLAELSVGVKLPWPLPDFEVGLTLEWGPEPVPPPLPLPLKEIAIEHLKVTTSWPLPRRLPDPDQPQDWLESPRLLLPDYDTNNDGFRQDPDIDPDDIDLAPPPILDQIPVVPLDCRPHITFGRHMNDDATVGVNGQPGYGVWERIGDPSKDPPEGPVEVRYGLKKVALEKYIGDDGEPPWEAVALKDSIWNEVEQEWVAVESNPDGEPTLFGSWAPVPATPDNGGENVAQAKLWLWSRNPFDYTRHGGRAWDEWFTERFADYPCVPIPDDRTICYDFEMLDPGSALTSPWVHPTEPALVFSWLEPGVRRVTILDPPVGWRTRALCLTGDAHLNIALPEPARTVRFVFARLPGDVTVTARTVSSDEIRRAISIPSQDSELVVTGTGITGVEVRGNGRVCLVAVCITVGLDDPERTRREEMAQHLIDELVRWEDEGDVLEPNTIYRLKVVTTIEAHGEGDLAGWEPTPDNPIMQTEYAYFRTEGPPGFAQFSRPLNLSENDEFASGLDDLTRYVRQTVPPTVPAPGEKSLLPRPVYRAYDVGVEFNEDYVDLMYKMARRDLGLYLYDNNNRPVYDAQGRLIVLNNRWGTTEDLILTESDEHYVTILDASECAALVQGVIPHDKTLTNAAEGQVLDPDTVYEARLIPLLFHEDFSENLAGWRVDNQGQNERPEDTSNWEVRGHETLRGNEATVERAEVNLDGSPELSVLNPDFDVIFLDSDIARPDGLYQIRSFDDGAKTVIVDGEPDLEANSSLWKIPMLGVVVQTSNIWGGSRHDRTDPNKPGTMLLLTDNANLPEDHLNRAGNWTDYRFSVQLRTLAPEDDAIGLVFRYHEDDGNRQYYRFSMDREGEYRRLVRVLETDEEVYHTILAGDDFVYRQDQDYLITIEAVGNSLKVYQDGGLVFDVTDGVLLQGGIGLYCWDNSGARFSDIRVDDFSPEARVIYRFKFTTSQFTNFFHHLHSYQDETWPGIPQDSIDTSESVALSEISSPSLDEEARAYEALAQAVLGPAAFQNPAQLEVTKMAQEGVGGDEDALAFLVQSPEPIDWPRVSLEILHAGRYALLPELPGVIKLTDVTFGASEPNEESVTLLLRETADLSGQRIEYRRLPGPIFEPTGDPVLLVDDFEEKDSGLLLREGFGPDALSPERDPYPYEIVDEGGDFGPPQWELIDGHIVQTSPIFGGSWQKGTPDRPKLYDKPGTLALIGIGSWANVRIGTTIRSEGNNAIGLVFRYQDADNFYRFSMDRWRNYRCLIKKVNGTVSLLWEDSIAYNTGQSYRLLIEAHGDRILGYLDDALLFSVQDPDISAGRAGFYCWLNPFAHFEALEVEKLEAPPLLWQPDFANLDEIAIMSEDGSAGERSQWIVKEGALIHLSGLLGEVEVDMLPQPGTFALAGSESWQDVQISVRMRSGGEGLIGVLFRVALHIDAEGIELGYNYYGFAMDRQNGHRRLVKKVGEAQPVALWQDNVSYKKDQNYELTLRTIGSELRGYLDGSRLFTIYDEDLKHGQVGFYAAPDTSVRFERVVITDPTRRVGHWTIHDEGRENPRFAWRQSGGVLRQGSNHPGTYAVAGSPGWRDYRLTVKLRSDADDVNDVIGVMFRYVDNDNYYGLFLQRNVRRLIKKENGVVLNLPLREGVGGYPADEQFTLTVDAVGSRLVGYMGEVRLFEITDSTHVAGQVGLYCRSNTGARFERVEVRRPPLKAYALFLDHFAGDDTEDWTTFDAQVVDEVQEGSSDWICDDGSYRQRSNIWSLPNDRETLTKKGTHVIAGNPAWSNIIFTARLQSFDDDAIGLLFCYSDEDNYYRFSMDSQRGYRRLVKNVDGEFSSPPLWEDDFAYEIGRTYELTIIANSGTLRGYMDGVPMFVVDDSDLATGQIGLYCWANHDARFSNIRVYPAELAVNDWLLDEPFDAPVPGHWLPAVDEGDQEGLSNWEYFDGELRQTSNIWGDTDENTGQPVPEYKPGTYVLAGDASWTDYRVSVRLRSDDNDAIGVMFRYVDENNYYRFSMDNHRRYRRLIKKADGMVSVLWEDDVRYTQHRDYVLTIDCEGERLTAYLDGVALFAVNDSTLDAGCIGLYSWRNTGARFSEVRVSAQVWATYYAFGREKRLPAGTRMQVFAGNAADAADEEPGQAFRFIASLDEHGQLRLPELGATLRVRAPGSNNGHTRHFLPDSDFVSLEDAKVMRKADGTGFFVLLPTDSLIGSQLLAGQYRLKFVYRRDNQDIDPNSQKLSQAGDSNPEYVTIDIPWGVGTFAS